MRFIISSLVAFGLAAAGSLAAPPNLTYLFNTTVSIGQLSKPIPVPGGVQIVEPLMGGKVFGPALNGTLSAGTGFPLFYNNETLMVNQIDSPGTTNDGIPFFVHQVGLGPLERQISRLEVTIGGQYAYLEEIFILGIINVCNTSFVEIEAYQVY